MKKLMALALAMLVFGAGYANAATTKVSCTVNGMKKIVASADACTKLGGTVVAKK